VNATPAIRQANLNDSPKIKEVIDLSFPRFYRYFASHSASDLSEPVLISELDGAVAGFAKVIEFHVGNIKYGCILWIAVHPANRRQGIALALSNASVDYLKTRGAKAVFASTQRRNRGALGTLSGTGFVRMGFLGLWRVFGWRVFEFYRDIWFAPGEVVLMHT
jgi:ribosomal protein S18 acetylase RimI-like enzyme